MTFQVFIVAFLVSYLGSIPPGTINVTSMQLSVQGMKRPAFFFALAASLTELLYAGLTVRFQIYLSDRPTFTENFQIITAIAMIVLGIANLSAKTNTKSILSKVHIMKGRNGFRRGVVLGLVNPLTIPFWLAVTAYLQNHKLIHLTGINYWLYLAGISCGTFGLLLTVNKLGQNFTSIADNQFLVHKLPGLVFISLGIYNFVEWLLI